MKHWNRCLIISSFALGLTVALVALSSNPAVAQEPGSGDVRGRVYLQGRGGGDWGGTLVSLQGPGGIYTTTTDADGDFGLTQIPSGTYTVYFTHTLFVSGLREGLSLSPGVTTTLPLAGLWAGDLDGDGDVDPDDWLVCAQASLPAGDPAFDLDADGVTDVRDCTRVLSNVGRPDMPSTDPPRMGLGY